MIEHQKIACCIVDLVATVCRPVRCISRANRARQAAERERNTLRIALSVTRAVLATTVAASAKQVACALATTGELAVLRRGVADVVNMLREPREDQKRELALAGLVDTALVGLLAVDDNSAKSCVAYWQLRAEKAEAKVSELLACELAPANERYLYAECALSDLLAGLSAVEQSVKAG